MSNLFKSFILIALLLGLSVAYTKHRTNTYITAEFKELTPFNNSAPIYYNGFKIGKVIKIHPNKTYTSTIVTMELHPHDLKLPINISANLKKAKNRWNKKYDYIDITYPKSPSIFFLKDGDRISGKTTVELETFLSNQDPASLEAIKNDLAESAKNLNITLQTLGDLFATLNEMASEVSPNVVDASSDIKKTSANIVKVSQSATDIANNVNGLSNNVTDALSSDRINSTTYNFQATSENVNLITKNLNNTIPQIACSLQQINEILNNVNEMTEGINCTMQKPFGGMRMIFGSPVSKKKCGCR